MKITKKLIILNFLMCSISITVKARSLSGKTPDSLVLNSTIRHGTLPNGLQYFIKNIENDQTKLYLQLHHKVGSSQEDQDQNDVAHAVEHLAFKATENFPQGIRNDDRIKKMGLDIFDISANNGTRGTNYFFEVPQGNSEALKKAFMWFKDIIQGLKITDSDINQVRGELKEESILRDGNNSNDYVTDARLKALIFSCNNELKSFIEHYDNFDSEVVRRFYHDWYRPDLIAISVVGRIDDIDQMEKNLRAKFMNLEVAETRRELRNCDFDYYSRPPQFEIIERPRDTLKILQNNEVKTHVVFRDPETQESLSTMKGQKRLLLMEFLSFTINQRFREATREYKSFKARSRNPFKHSGLSPSLEVLIDSDIGMEKKAVERTTNILNQLRQWGVTKHEWENLKETQQRYLTQNDTSDTRFWIKEIQAFYLNGEPLPNQKYPLLVQWFTNLSMEDFNSYIREFFSKIPEDIGIIAPSNSDILTLTENEVRTWITDEFKKSVVPYETPDPPSFIIHPNEISKLPEKEYNDLGIGLTGAREIKLNNGVKVILKNLKGDPKVSSEIRIHGFSMKGLSWSSEKHYYSAINSPSIVKNSGVNGLDKFRLNRFLSLTTSMTTGGPKFYISNQGASVQGTANMNDFETFLQLVYLYFTKPEKNPDAFEDWKKLQYELFLKPSYNLVKADFNNAIMEATGEKPGNSTLGRKMVLGTVAYEGVLLTNFELAMSSYKEIFGNAKEFTFIFSGTFDETAILPLIQKYLGNLPDSAPPFKDSTKRDQKGKLPKGPILMNIPSPKYYKMQNMNYGVRFIQEAEDPFDWREKLRVMALGGLTNKKVWDLRFEKGYSLYNINFGGRYNWDMNRYELFLTLSCPSVEYEALRREFKGIIEEIKAGKVSESELQQGLERIKFKHSAHNADRPFVLDEKLYYHYRYGHDWVDPVEVEAFIESLTIEDIIKTAKTYYKDEKLYEFTME